MHKVCTGIEKSVFATLLIFYLFLAKWTTVHNLVLFTLTLSHIIATRVGLDLSSMTTGSRGVQFELDNKESLTSLMAVIC